MRVRRHTAGSGTPWVSSIRGRRLLKQAGLVVAAFLAGYLIAAFVIFPTPLFSSDHSVPRVLDEDGGEARGRLESQGFRVRVDGEEPHPHAPKGAVIWQDPAPGTSLAPGTSVHMTVSSGPGAVTVPDLIGFDASLAARVVEAAGLTVGGLDSIPAGSETGTVVATRPGAGSSRDPGSPVQLVVSSGPAQISVPDLFGMTLDEARDRLNQVGLPLGETLTRTTNGPAGVVIEQRPLSGTLVARTTRIAIYISKKPLP
jgi:beta-lactam-binding protein with PASTA domain